MQHFLCLPAIAAVLPAPAAALLPRRRHGLAWLVALGCLAPGSASLSATPQPAPVPPRPPDARTLGAVGDGASHPIGRRFGDTLDAAADWRDRTGQRPNAWMLDPQYGLRFPLAVSAAQDAPGRTATFLVTVPTILGLQSFAQFNGDPANGQKQLAPGWLASGPGIPPGTSVTALDIGTGTVTFSQATSQALSGGAAVVFTIPPPVFRALEMDYVGVQAAIDQSARQGGGLVTLPAGDYRWNHSVWNPGIADGSNSRGNVSLAGTDPGATRIAFTSDLGPGGCALGDRNRGPGSTGHARYARFRLQGPGAPRNDGTPVAGMDGLCVGQAVTVEDVVVQRFHAGVNMVKDHGVISRADVSNNFYGFYFGPNGDSIGNWRLRDSGANANSWAGLAVAWNNQVDFSVLENLDLGGGTPYAIYREPTPAGQRQVAGFLSNSVLNHVFSEQVGLGWILAENPGDQVDRNIFLHCTAWMDPVHYKIAGRRARAVMAAGRITGNTFIGSDLGSGGANALAVSEAVIVARDNIQSNDWGDLTGSILDPRPRKPFLAAPTVLFNAFRTDRGAGVFLRAEDGMRTGRVVAFGTSRFGSGIRAMEAGRRVRGVAAQTVEAGQVLPVLTSGLATVDKTPGQPIGQGDPVMASSVNPGAVTALAPNTLPNANTNVSTNANQVLGIWQDEGSAAAGATTGTIMLGGGTLGGGTLGTGP